MSRNEINQFKKEYDFTGDLTIAVDLIARAIYGEQTRTEDNGQEAVAWTMINRRNQPGQEYYGWDYTDIVLAESQYSAMEQEGGNMQSYKPTTTDDGWINAVLLATLMVADGTRNVNIKNDIGFGTTYRADDFFYDHHRIKDGQNQFYTGGRWHNVSDVHDFNGNTFFNFID